MTLKTIQIDPTTWSAASPQKQLEWQSLCADLTEAEDFAFSPDAHELRVSLAITAIDLEVIDAQGQSLIHETLKSEEWQALRQEYLETIAQMQAGDDPELSNRLEVLDMAKKATHDRAARWLRQRFPRFELNVATARRLFSLLISLHSLLSTTRAHQVLQAR